MVSRDELVEFAYADIESEQPKDMLSLSEIVINTTVTEDVVRAVLRLAEREAMSESFAIREWSWLLVQDFLESPPSETVEGMLELSDLWATFGYPSWSPFLLQGLGDDQSTPLEYFSHERYATTLAEHRVWLSDELERLRAGI